MPNVEVISLKPARTGRSFSPASTEVQNLAFKPGCMTALIGPNGSGKSTVVNGLMGLRPDLDVQARVNKTAYTNTPPPHRHLLGFASQQQSFPPGLKVGSLLAFHRRAHGLTQTDATARGLEPSEFAGRVIDKLSGGQKQRLNLFLALGHGPELVILDEPEGSLDEKTIRIVKSALQARNAAGLTSIVATHDAEILSAAQDVVLIEDGRVSSHGGLGQLMNERLGAGVLEITFENAAERVRLMRVIAESRERRLIVSTDPLKAMVFGTEALKDISNDPRFGCKRMGLAWRSVTAHDLLLSLEANEVHLPLPEDHAPASEKSA